MPYGFAISCLPLQDMPAFALLQDQQGPITASTSNQPANTATCPQKYSSKMQSAVSRPRVMHCPARTTPHRRQARLPSALQADHYTHSLAMHCLQCQGCTRRDLGCHQHLPAGKHNTQDRSAQPTQCHQDRDKPLPSQPLLYCVERVTALGVKMTR